MASATLIALLALVPMSIGPLPIQPLSILARICGGGTIEIPIKREKQKESPCFAKGCHAGACRKRFDLRQ